MTILVSDTSVLVDLGRGALLEACFGLRMEFAVPDLLYQRELATAEGPRLRELGLRVEELSGAEVATAQAIRSARNKLSLPDAFAFTLAQSRGWELLTGDGELRSYAQEQGIVFHGVLWMCDRIFEAETVAPADLAAALETIIAHPRCRLPKTAVEACLKRYRDGIVIEGNLPAA